MYLKSLTISKHDKIIRKIEFHYGINLIVDETPMSNDIILDNKETGNNVGKTTVLKLIDFCLGGNPKNIYIDPENKKNEYLLVKNYLIRNEILITLILSNDLENKDALEIIIERNFLQRSKSIRRINGQDVSLEDFESKLSNLIFPEHISEKPTFRQIISHNIRYTDERINNTLKTLDKYTSGAEYETLHLFLFGCDFSKGNEKLEVLTKLKQEDSFKSRLEKDQTKTTYETTLSIINNEIEELNRRKLNFNININFESDLIKLNEIKFNINYISSEISTLKIRKDIIENAESELNAGKSEIDLNQLHLIYIQAKKNIEGIQKTFEDLVLYHNKMVIEKIKFIKKELPELNNKIERKNKELRNLLVQESNLTKNISKSDSFENLENLIVEINEKYRQKGEYENIINQLNEVESNIREYKSKLIVIDEEIFSNEFEENVKIQRDKFNKYFAKISNILYGETYALSYDIVEDKKGQKIYKFNSFNTNFSSGKKQGEISCFDIAYTLFADDENIPCLHFLLNDKKELMHDNQLVKITHLVNKNKIQFVASILRDKLPEELNNDKYFIIKLFPQDKLLRIENYK